MSFSGIKMRLVYYAQELSSVFDIGVQRAVDSTETPLLLRDHRQYLKQSWIC